MTRYGISSILRCDGGEFCPHDAYYDSCGDDEYDLVVDLPDVAPGESLRLTRTPDGWDVRRLVLTAELCNELLMRGDRDALDEYLNDRPWWVDAPEQEGDR